MGPKVWGLLCPFLEGAGSSTNTVWPGHRLTSVPSVILIYPTVCPQHTNVTDGTDRQTDRQTEQWSDSIARTVLQMVAQKSTKSRVWDKFLVPSFTSSKDNMMARTN